ncbi:hypothetical protein F4677DRAFT_412309 [Hypoxylon crocopeplum]|nr:hypothetical protein F4677DRAFT_412309 [Hypoxylon crocopeplum]
MDATNLNPSLLELYTYDKIPGLNDTLDVVVDLETLIPLDNGRHSIQPRQSLGQLDILPNEVTSDILLALDLPTLTRFRRVNHRAMDLIDSLRQYRMIYKHCANVLRAVISVDATYTCKTLYETLSTTCCKSCGQFGGYLYLITCERVCYSCFYLSPRYRPVEITFAPKCPEVVSTLELMHVPRVLSLPPSRGPKRDVFLDRWALLRTTIKLWPWIPDWMALVQKREYALEGHKRYMTIISAPYFSSTGKLACRGFFCALCRDHELMLPKFAVKYTECGILEHISNVHGVTAKVNQ